MYLLYKADESIFIDFINFILLGYKKVVFQSNVVTINIFGTFKRMVNVYLILIGNVECELTAS